MKCKIIFSLYIQGVIAHGPKGETLCLPLSPDSDHKVINPGGLTVLIGTNGPKQTVYGTGKLQGPLRVIPSPQKIPGVSQQTLYSPSGGTVVLVGTGGPTQTVHHSGSHHEHHDQFDHDGYPIHDTNLNNQRGDQPGHLIPGYSRIDDSLPSTNGRDRIDTSRGSSDGSRGDIGSRTTGQPSDNRGDRGGDDGRGSGDRTGSGSDRRPESPGYDDRRGSGGDGRRPGYDSHDREQGSRGDERGNQSGQGSQSSDRDGSRDNRNRPGWNEGDRRGPSGAGSTDRDQGRGGYRPGPGGRGKRFFSSY